jgi:hypothetical protein
MSEGRIEMQHTHASAAGAETHQRYVTAPGPQGSGATPPFRSVIG